MTLKELVNSISKKEWRWVILLTIVLILLTNLPYLYAALNAPTGYFWDGIHAITPGDSLVYFSYLTQVKAEHWLLQDNYTSEPQSGGLLNLFWLFLGLIGKIFNLSPIITFHLARIFLIPLFIFVLYLLVSYFWAKVFWRKIAMIFLCFSSGIGAYFVDWFDKLFPATKSFAYKWLMDIWIPDSNIFLSLYQSPHFIFSLTLLILFFLLMILSLNYENLKYSFYAGLLGFFWFNFHPFYFPYVFFIMFIYLIFLVFKKRKYTLFINYFLALFLSLPFIIYHYYKIKTDFAIGGRAIQNVTRTPDFLFVSLGFGFLLVGAVLGIMVLIYKRKLLKDEKYFFIFAWLVAGFLLVYSPIFFQARFLQGLQIPMVFLTLIFLEWLGPILQQRCQKFFNLLKGNYVILGFFFLVFFGFSTFFNLVRDVYYYEKRLPYFYLPNEYLQATSWLQNNNQNRSPILASEFNGNLIPAFLDQQVFFAHSIETLNYNPKRQELADFFNDNYSAEQTVAFLQKYNLNYLFFSETDRQASRFKPEEKKYLEKVFSQGQLEIYKLKI
ncbi:MAG: hypothetical protein NTX00_02335 [Candidatus Parcubacteria bacterium]|nr:hypothetical protein [Candidatus Parcubacteria bacterium]